MPFCVVCFSMRSETSLSAEQFTARATPVFLISRVYRVMFLQVPFTRERSLTFITFVGFLSRVKLEVTV